MIRVLRSRRRHVVAVGAVAAIALLAALVAVAYWTASGFGSGNAAVGALAAPTGVSVPSTSNGTVHVTWTGIAGPDGSAASAYYVERFDGSTPHDACGTDPTDSNTWLPAAPTSCDDTAVPDGSFTYRVNAVWHSWSSQSAASNPVVVVGKVASSTDLTSSLNPSQVGDLVTYAAAVTGGATATGTVEFLDGGVPLAACGGAGGVALDGAGKATCDQTYGSPASHSISAEYSGDAHHFTSSDSLTQTVNKGDQTIMFTSTAPANARVGGATYAPTATGGASGQPVTFTIDGTATGVCSISGGVVSFSAVGTCIVDANQAGDGDYNAAPQKQQSFAVAKGDQTIAFTQPADLRFDQTPAALSATATSGLTVTFTSATPTVCTVSGSSVSLVHAGTCTINADQAGSTNWNAASAATRSFAVNKGNQTIFFGKPADLRFDQTPSALGATAGSGLGVSFTSTTPTVCTVSGTTVTLVHAGVCTIDADQAGNGDWNAALQVVQSFSIAKGNQSITFGALGGVRMDQGPVTLGATASSGLGVTYGSTTTTVCSVSGSSVTLLHVGTCTINANQGGNSDWNAATQVTQSFSIAKGNQTITFNPSNVRLDQGPVTLTASATSGLAVTYASTTPTVCTVSGSSVTLLHAGTCTINANQGGNADWNGAAQVTQSFTINKGNQTITFGSLPDIRLDQSPVTASATTSSGLAATFSITGAANCSVAGTSIALLHTGNCNVKADVAASADWNSASATQSFNIAKGNQTVTFGAAPVFARTGVAATATATATSGLAVGFGSTTTPVCTINATTGVLNFAAVGLCALTGDQSGNADWNGATQATQQFQVYNGATAGLVWTGVTVNGGAVTPSCTGTVGSTYSCTVTAGTNAALAATVEFATAAKAASTFSAADMTIAASYTGKNGTGTPASATVTGGTALAGSAFTVQKNGNSAASITATFTLPGGGTWTAVLQTG